jgi:hypothetical protein
MFCLVNKTEICTTTPMTILTLIMLWKIIMKLYEVARLHISRFIG